VRAARPPTQSATQSSLRRNSALVPDPPHDPSQRAQNYWQPAISYCNTRATAHARPVAPC
jgi:hypothetical protein